MGKLEDIWSRKRERAAEGQTGEKEEESFKKSNKTQRSPGE